MVKGMLKKLLSKGVGAAATWTSNLSILMARFPDRKATVKVKTK